MSRAVELLSYAMRHPIGRRQRLRTISRIVGWQIKSRLLGGPFVHDWIEGSKLRVSRGMTGATGNIYFGLHEFSDMGMLLHLLRSGDLFLDIGANVGTYSILAAKVCGADVWAFEPSTDTRALLLANVQLNQIGDRVRVLSEALGDRSADVPFARGLGAMNRITDDKNVDSEMVSMRRLDDLIGDAVPVMMKIDVEGHEPALFRGARETLARPGLQVVEVETVDDSMRRQLTGLGFVECFYDPLARTLLDGPCAWPANNALFVRDRAFVLDRVSSAAERQVLGVTL